MQFSKPNCIASVGPDLAAPKPAKVRSSEMIFFFRLEIFFCKYQYFAKEINLVLSR